MFHSPVNSRLFAFTVLLAVLVGCSSAVAPASSPGGPSDKLQVTVSVLPQKYFVERIGGEYVEVNVMVGPGDDPHTYEPKPAQMRALSRSAAYFSVGVDFENAWLDRIAAANRDMLVVDTVADIERLPVTAHAHEGEESGLDPHVWTSPALVKVQAQAIYGALARLDAAHKDVYKANLESFMADIDALEADIRKTLEGVENRKFMVFHPAWGYLARDFGLEQIPVEVGGQEPSATELAILIRRAREEGITVIFAQPEFSTKAAETIAREIGGKVLLISPLAPDWLDNMQEVAEAFAEALD